MVKNIFKVLVSNMVVLFTSFINTLIIPKILTIDGYAEYQMFINYFSLKMKVFAYLFAYFK